MFRFRLVALAASFILLGARHNPATIFDLSDAVGRHAPNVKLAENGGASLALDDLHGKPAYVFLFASWCAPCTMSFPFVREDFAKYGDRVTFVGVDVLDDAPAARGAIARAAFDFPVAVFPVDRLDALISPDAQLAAGEKYRVPADYLLDANGVVRFAWHGLAVERDGTPVDVLPSYLAKLGIQ